MVGISTCRISVPAFSSTPGPLEEEEVRQAAEEMEQLSSEVSFFHHPRRGSSFEESARASDSEPLRFSPIPNQFASIFQERFPGEEEDTESDLIEFSCFDVVRANYFQGTHGPSDQSHLAYDSNLSSFPRFPPPSQNGKLKHGGPDQSSLKVFNPNYPSFIPAKLNPPFVVHVDEIPQASTCVTAPVPDLVYENSENSASVFPPRPLTKRAHDRHGGKENANRHRPAIRRKPVPKVILEDKIQESSVTKFSHTKHSFLAAVPACSPDSKAEPPEGGPGSKTIQRTNAIGKYTLTQFLSQGAQGKVYLSKVDKTNKLSAIKVISKLTLENYSTLLQEQDLLKRIKGHPFVLNLIDSFHDTENFYLVSDYHRGGDLAHLLYKLKTFDINMARFYISELIVAIKFLHSNEIIHRDLKPSNILIKADGHICIVDFGLCKDFHPHSKKSRPRARYVRGTHQIVTGPLTDGFAGTLVYMSPQVISQELYSYETDWWSMGIILYELLQGDTPWTSSDVTCMIRKIRKEPVHFRLPIDDAASDFLLKLLEKRVEDRIHVSDFSRHEFFHPIDFSEVESGSLTPPYMPQTSQDPVFASVLKEKEKIYVGRRYEPDVDPFPEYNYDYQPPEHIMNLEDLADILPATLPCPDLIDQFEALNPHVPTHIEVGVAPTTPRTKLHGSSIFISPLKLDQTISSALLSRLYKSRNKSKNEIPIDIDKSDLGSDNENKENVMIKSTLSPRDVFHTPRRSPAPSPLSSRLSRSMKQFHLSVASPSRNKSKRLHPTSHADVLPLPLPLPVSPSAFLQPKNSCTNLNIGPREEPSPLRNKGAVGPSFLNVGLINPRISIRAPTKASVQSPGPTLNRSALCLTPPTPSFFTASRSFTLASPSPLHGSPLVNENSSNSNSNSNYTSNYNSNFFAGNSLFSVTNLNLTGGASEGYLTETTLPSTLISAGPVFRALNLKGFSGLSDTRLSGFDPKIILEQQSASGPGRLSVLGERPGGADDSPEVQIEEGAALSKRDDDAIVPRTQVIRPASMVLWIQAALHAALDAVKQVFGGVKRGIVTRSG